MPALEFEVPVQDHVRDPASAATSSRLVVTNPERANARAAASRI